MSTDKKLQEPVEHGTFEMPLAFYELDTKIYSEYYLHWHEEMEIMLISRGSIIVTVNQKEIRGVTGDFILIGRNMLHSIKKDHSDPQTLYFTSLVFHPRILEGCTEDYCQKNLAGPMLEGRIEFPFLIRPDHNNYSSIKKEFLRLFAAYKEKGPFYEFQLKGILFELFAAFLAGGDFRQIRKNPNKTAESVVKALDYIGQHYSDDINVSALASMAGYNESYFMKTFKKQTGVTVVHFINDYRLRKSAELLLGSSDSIEEVAYSTGFESASYFIRKFKEKYRVTPNEYRKHQEK